MKYFVIEFDTESARLISITEYASAEEALAARLAAEVRHEFPSAIEVVILRAPSEDAIRESHPRYFARM